jgi:LysM repeat protein
VSRAADKSAKARATHLRRGVALIITLMCALLIAGCDGAVGSSGERVRLLITPVPSPTPIPPILPTAEPIRYTVGPGDTLYGIALTFGVSIDDIVRANNIADPNSLSEGQVLTIPQRSAPPTANLTAGPTAEASPTGAPEASPSPNLPPPDATPPQGPEVPILPDETPAEVPSATPGLLAPEGNAPAIPPAQPTNAAGSAELPLPVPSAGPPDSP